MIISVASGKGGVGKSLVASLAAVALRHEGYEVGILDADITSPGIPKMFGITNRPAYLRRMMIIEDSPEDIADLELLREILQKLADIE